MAKAQKPNGISEALKAAVDKTYAATAGPLGETRERAAGVLDDVVRRGERAREAVSERGERAREAVSERVEGLREGVGRVVPGKEELGRVEEELAAIGKRLEELEASLRRRGKSTDG